MCPRYSCLSRILATVLADHLQGSSVIIAVVTFGLCIGGLIIGKTVGNKISNKATILGGVILIGIGIEIWVRGIFF